MDNDEVLPLLKKIPSEDKDNINTKKKNSPLIDNMDDSKEDTAHPYFIPINKLEKIEPQFMVESYIHCNVFEAIMEHCVEFGKENKEALGLLLGYKYIYNDVKYIIIEERATSSLDSTSVSVKINNFDEMFMKLDALAREDRDYLIVGWYHSHPGYTCFLSPTDVNTQKQMFNKDFQVAMVVDPIIGEVKMYKLDGSNNSVEVPYSVYK